MNRSFSLAHVTVAFLDRSGEVLVKFIGLGAWSSIVISLCYVCTYKSTRGCLFEVSDLNRWC